MKILITGANGFVGNRLMQDLAKAAKEQKLICFSSDQVYRGCAGEGPYKEEDASPCNVYGRHKLEMEQRVLDVKPDAVMLRAEWMYDYPTKRSNYLRMLLNEKQVLTFGKQYRGITYLREVAENMPTIFKRSRRCMISPVKCCTS